MRAGCLLSLLCLAARVAGLQDQHYTYEDYDDQNYEEEEAADYSLDETGLSSLDTPQVYLFI